MNKKPLLITTGIVFVVLVASIWIYLLLYGTPSNPDEVYSNLGFEMQSQPTTTTPPQNLDTESSPQINTDTSEIPLQQLTTRPVAGFIQLDTASSSIVRYVERGTGYIYEIDLASGEESLTTQTTLPQVAEAVFSTDGSQVAMTSYSGYTTTVYVGSADTAGSFSYSSLEPGAHSLAFSERGDVLYAISQAGVTRGYAQNLATETRREIFSFDFVNTAVSWGEDYDSIYLTTKPARNLPSYIYTINETVLDPILPPVTNLHAFITPNHSLATFATEAGVRSVAVARDGVQHTLPLTTIPSKCVADSTDSNGLWCAAPVNIDTIGFLEDWNKGVEQSDDMIWYIDINRETASLRANPDRLSGRSLDVDYVTHSENGRYLLLRNRTDQTLWLLDTDTL